MVVQLLLTLPQLGGNLSHVLARSWQGVTTVLYPLTVIKTKQMTLPGIEAGLQVRGLGHPCIGRCMKLACLAVGLTARACQWRRRSMPPELQGARQTASTVYRQEGIAGFYRGFGTVICGTIPARVVRSCVHNASSHFDARSVLCYHQG